MFTRSAPRRGFSLIELVIVVVIIGIIAAIAIPRMSRGSEGAAESALVGDLAVMRNAVDLFATEHTGTWPGNHGSSTFEQQMIYYTDDAGAHSTTKSATHIYGPYLRKIPPMPLGDHKGDSGVAIVTSNPAAEDATAGVGWIYNKNTGQMFANATGYLTY